MNDRQTSRSTQMAGLVYLRGAQVPGQLVLPALLASVTRSTPWAGSALRHGRVNVV
jgi:hypothetical protein